MVDICKPERLAAIVPATPDESTCDSRQLCANQLGSDDFDRQTRADERQHTSARDGSWEGSFFRHTPSHMPGGWEAKRWPAR